MSLITREKYSFPTLIKTESKNILDFIVKYELYRIKSNKHNFYNVKLSKTKAPSLTPIEESIVCCFEQREEEAIKIFEMLVKNDVTPMCLEDIIYELI